MEHIQTNIRANEAEEIFLKNVNHGTVVFVVKFEDSGLVMEIIVVRLYRKVKGIIFMY